MNRERNRDLEQSELKEVFDHMQRSPKVRVMVVCDGINEWDNLDQVPITCFTAM
jgi:hypothetical protein